MADIERGQRIKARREQLHLTQPAVVELMEALARELPLDDDLHPANAMKAPITLRGFQAYERGGGIVWGKAKLLAGALQMDVREMMLGEVPETPDPFTPQPVALEGMQADILNAIMQQLAMQTKVLQEIRSLLLREGEVASALEVATARVDEASSTLAETAAQAGRVLRDGVLRPVAAAPKPARKRIPRASKRSPA